MARDLKELQKRYNSAYARANAGKAQPGGPGRGPGGPGGPRGQQARMSKSSPKQMKKTVRRLLGYIAPYKLLIILVLVCMAFSTGASLIGSYMLRPIINHVAMPEYDMTVTDANGEALDGIVFNGGAIAIESTSTPNIPASITAVGEKGTLSLVCADRVAAGGETTVEVYFDAAVPLDSLKFSLTFDPERASVNASEDGAIKNGGMFADSQIIKNTLGDDGVYNFRATVGEGSAIAPGRYKVSSFTLDVAEDASGIIYIEKGASNVAERISYLGLAVLFLGCVYLVGVVASYCQSRMMLTVSQGAVARLREELFGKLQSLPVRYYDTKSTGEIMSRFTNDVDNIGMMLDHTLVSLISGSVTLIGTFVMMVYTNIWLTLITVIFVPIFMKCGAFIINRSRKFYHAQQEALGAVNGYIEESASGQKVIKVFCHEDVSLEEFGMLNGDLRKKQESAQFFGGIMGPVLGNLSQVSYAVTAGVGGVLCALGRFDVGGLAVFVNYARQFSRPINEISQQTSTVFSALAGAERVFEVIDSKSEDELDAEAGFVEAKERFGDGGRPKIKGEVVLDGVTFGYNPDKTVLRNVSLYARPGQKIAFVGSTGAGKTTITNLINRFYDVQSGSITIDGRDIRDFDRSYLRSNIAMVLQDTHLFTGTVMENIRYGRLDATDDEVIAAAKTANAHSFIMRLSDGYQTMLSGDGANLSQGQRQLLNIARAAVSHAPILILDEATSSVDTRTERKIERGMDSLMENRTTFVIAHRLSTVRNANAIMVLEQGEVIERGDHDALLEQKGRYYELYTGKKELD